MPRLSSRWVLAGILVVGAAVRFYRIDVTWFLLDHVRDVTAAVGVASGTGLPLLGPRIGSTEAYLGPLYYYLLAVPFSLAGDPVAAVVYVALGQLAALLALYRFACEFFGNRVALYATAFAAVFPLTILGSRLVWHVGLMPLGIVLLMHALFRLIVSERSSAVVALLALLGVLTQLHLTAIAFAGIAFAALLLTRIRVRPLHAILGVALFAVVYLPYLLHELAHGFENSLALIRSVNSDQGLSRFASMPSVAGNLALLFAPALQAFDIVASQPPTVCAAFKFLYGAETLAFWCGLALCAAGVLIGASKERPLPNVPRRQALLLLLWIVVPVLVVESNRTPTWWYYLDVVHPAPFLLAGIAFASLPSRLRSAAACLAVAIVAAQALLLVDFQRRADERGELSVDVPRLCINRVDSPFRTLVTLPLHHRREIVRTLLRDLGIGENAFFDQVHGAVLGLDEENRYLVARQSKSRSTTDPVAARDAHYLVTRAADVAQTDNATRVGPYAIVEQQPIVTGWSCAVVSGLATPATRWTPVSLPTSNADFILGDGQRLVCRATVLSSGSPAKHEISVSLLGWVPFDVVGLQVGEQRLQPAARVERQDPLMLKEAGAGWAMGIGWTSETVFELAEAPAGAVTIEIAGKGKLIALDVYGGRSW